MVIVLNDLQNVPSSLVFPEPDEAPNKVRIKNTQVQNGFIFCNKLLPSVNAVRINTFRREE